MRITHSLTVFVVSVALAGPAEAIPAFARRYGTSCQTCHSVYPKLTPFGEAFRRNGYHFPGVDSDYVKQEPVELGQEAGKQLFPNQVWPGTLAPSVPIAVGFNGQAVVHPDKNSGAAQADNGANFTMHDLIAEGHVWAGGAYDDHLSFFSEFTFADSAAEVEKAKVIISDWLGPKHAVNLVVGRDSATINSFGAKSSYLVDAPVVSVPVTALYGATSDSFNIGDNYNGVELNGMFAGRVDYSVGLNAGANADIRPSETFYGHLGVKLGGLRLDGEGAEATSTRPWAETALTVDAFAYRSTSRFALETGDTLQDSSTTLGGQFRAQVQSLELDSGAYHESHNHAQADGTSVSLITQYDELSYVVFPWFVPAVRFEYLRLEPEGGGVLHDTRIIPGAAFLLRPNLKFVLAGQLENAAGAPPAGWGAAGGFAAPADQPVKMELESISVGLFTAF